MKLPRWAQALLSIAVIVAILTIASRFSEKSLVYAEGSISIAPELTEKAAEQRNLFIVVYDQDNPAPMPYGALRVQLAEAPSGTFHHFVLTRENLTVMAGKQAGNLAHLRIKARLTNSGFIGQDGTGDLYGEVSDVALGGSDVRLLIDKVQ
jgi:hypothetical protein